MRGTINIQDILILGLIMTQLMYFKVFLEVTNLVITLVAPLEMEKGVMEVTSKREVIL